MWNTSEGLTPAKLSHTWAVPVSESITEQETILRQSVHPLLDRDTQVLYLTDKEASPKVPLNNTSINVVSTVLSLSDLFYSNWSDLFRHPKPHLSQTQTQNITLESNYPKDQGLSVILADRLQHLTKYSLADASVFSSPLGAPPARQEFDTETTKAKYLTNFQWRRAWHRSISTPKWSGLWSTYLWGVQLAYLCAWTAPTW